MFFSAILSSLRLVKLPRKINYHNLQVLLSERSLNIRKSSGLTLELEIFSFFFFFLTLRIYFYLFFLFFSHSIPLGRPSAPAPSIQYRASNLDWQLISYMIFSLTLSLSVHRMVIWRSGWSGQKQERHSLKYLVVPESKEVLKKWCDFSSHVKSTQKYCKSTILQLKKFLKIK